MSDESDNEMDQDDRSQINSQEHEAKIEKQIRKKYRKMREEMLENRLECVDPKSNRIEAMMEKIERTYNCVKKPREAVSDSIVLQEIAVLGQERIKNLHCAFRSFSNIEFMDKLKVYMSEHSLVENLKQRISSDEDIESEENETQSQQRSNSGAKKYVLTKPIISKFGTNAMSYFRISPKPKFLIGTLEKELKLSKKAIVRQKRQRNDDEIVKTKIKELNVNSEEETNNTVQETERIHKILSKYFKRSKGRALCLYEFMINPNSFSRTIENIFYISFLIKDGFAKIYLDEDQLPVIVPVSDEQKTQANNASGSKSINIQSMISLNKIQWKELIEVFEIENAIIPDLKT